MSEFDFSGWATRNDLLCGDGRTIRKDAFKDDDGNKVPLVWNHQHNDPENVLGHALLENREDGVYAYCTFNDTESGKSAKELVQHGDVRSLSIYANKLKQRGGDVIHGTIRELSLVLAGANPGAYIDYVMAHSEDGEDEFEASWDENIMIYHSEEKANEDKKSEEPKEKESKDMADKEKSEEKTVQDVIDSMTEEQRNVLYGLVGMAAESGADKEEDGGSGMKHNVFDADEKQGNFLSHADEAAIIADAKRCGSLQHAMQSYMEENSLQHGFADYEDLFPENEWIHTPGAPEKIDKDYNWVSTVLNKVHKSPIARVRSRYVDLREADIRGRGYTKAQEKQIIGEFDMIGRSFDPQTIYVKEKMERDDILDITDFDVVDYVKGVMRDKLNLEIARAILIGDGRANGHADKIKEAHIQPVWTDAELYTIHQDVDIATAKTELQGTDTNKHFGDNYVYAEAIITAALYAREKYKGSGSLDFFCTPHLLNVMLLARDLNGRRIYDSKADLAAALNVNNIFTVEEFEGKQRTLTDGSKKKLLGLFYNLSDYQIGGVKNGQITSFEDFDIDFNQYKYLMETRISGANTMVFSAIALEEPVVTAAAQG